VVEQNEHVRDGGIISPTVIGQNLAKKILAVQRGAANIPKNGYNDFHKYYYVLAADAVEAIRELCVANKLVITTLGVNGVTKVAEVTTKNSVSLIFEVHITYAVTDPDSGESVTFDWVGHGADPMDKGIFKAFTGAQKYGIMQFFMVAGDDADPETPTARERRPEKKTPGTKKNESPEGSTDQQHKVRIMKSKYDNGFCWFCKKKHISADQEIVGLEDIAGETKAVWGCRTGYEKWKEAQLDSTESGAPDAEEPAAESLEALSEPESDIVTVGQIKAMTPRKRMDILLSRPKAKLVALANREMARHFENNTKVGDQFLLALLEEHRLTSAIIDENEPRDIARLVCELWDRETGKGKAYAATK
jgi:hypothetical protein